MWGFYYYWILSRSCDAVLPPVLCKLLTHRHSICFSLSFNTRSVSFCISLFTPDVCSTHQTVNVSSVRLMAIGVWFALHYAFFDYEIIVFFFSLVNLVVVVVALEGWLTSAVQVPRFARGFLSTSSCMHFLLPIMIKRQVCLFINSS